jgi:hypothetical protein
MHTALVALMLLAAPATWAQVQLQGGQVACLSLKHAKAYATNAAQAPAFAEDQIARANCFRNEKPQPAIKLSEQKGYAQYQLLSGHKVWVPSTLSSSK